MKKGLLVLLVIAMLLPGCRAEESCARQTIFCMDTVMDLQMWGADREKAMADVIRMLEALEKTWSATDENSFLAALNRGETAPNDEQRALLDLALSLQAQTGGAFDPQLHSVVTLWGFYDDNYRIPSAQELQTAQLEKKWDLGGILKGYAGDLAVEILERYDIERAILNLGGNVQTYGQKSDHTAWNIGIQNPNGTGYLGQLAVTGKMSVVTSGDYQRNFELNGKRYHHILDPQTGCPAESGLCSVTVVCADGGMADALSTALFVMGLERATAFWRQSEGFEAVFVLSTGEIYATEGAALSGCQYEVIRHEN